MGPSLFGVLFDLGAVLGQLEVEHNGKRWLFSPFLLGNKLKETGEEGERRYVKESILTPLNFVCFSFRRGRRYPRELMRREKRESEDM